jgi:hypothetical protein
LSKEDTHAHAVWESNNGNTANLSTLISWLNALGGEPVV